jgi:hypothetical protein
MIRQIRSDKETKSTATVLVATGNDFESANAAVMYHARTLLLNISSKHNEEAATLTEDVKPEWYESWYDGLGYCEFLWRIHGLARIY